MKSKLMQCKMLSYYDYIIAVAFTIMVLIFVYQLWEINIFKVPFVYGGDGLTGLAASKMMITEDKLFFESDRLGAPFGYAAYDGAQSTYLPNYVKKAVTIISSNWIFVTNFSYLSGFVIISCVSLAVLKKLGIDRRVAVILSILYSCLPYHFLRGEAHYSLSLYLPVPIAVYYIVQHMQGNILSKSRNYLNWNNIKYLMAMIIIGIGGLYYAFFTCFFICVAAVYILINEKKIQRLMEPLLSIVIITGSVVIGYIPTIVYKLKFGENPEGIIRAIGEIDLYGLKFSQLIMPITNHRIDFLADFKRQYNKNYVVNENDMVSLGLIFTIGFLVLLLYIWKKDRVHKKSYLHEVSCLNLAALLYATVGGAISIQGVFFSMLRAGNRISIFIAFFSCICMGVLLSNFIQEKISCSKYLYLLLGCIFIVGIFDCTQKSYVNKEKIITLVNSDQKFIEKIEEMEEEGMILQLPLMKYPENGNIVYMGDYAHMIGYLYSDHLKWSYGVYKGRNGSNLLDELETENLSAFEMALTAARMGYKGIYINRDGYLKEDLNKLENGLRFALKCEPVKSSLEDKVYFSLKDFAKQHAIATDYCSLEFVDGVYDQEENAEFMWRWVDQKSQFRIYSWAEDQQKVNLTFKVQSYWPEGNYTLSVKGKNENLFQIYPEETICSMEVELDPGFNMFEMSTDAPLIEAEGDDRNLCFMLTDYSFGDSGYN